MKKKILKIMLYIIDKMGYKYTVQKETLAHLQVYSNYSMGGTCPSTKLTIINHNRGAIGNGNVGI